MQLATQGARTKEHHGPRCKEQGPTSKDRAPASKVFLFANWEIGEIEQTNVETSISVISQNFYFASKVCRF